MSESAGKDSWDKVQAIGTILSGIAVPVLLFMLAQKADVLQKAAGDAARERDAAARDRELAQGEVSVRVAQANIIPPLIDGLLSSDPQRRRLATSAILIALPEDGPRLVRELGAQATDAEVRSYATTALKNRKEQLVTDLYAPEAATRTTAARALVQGWNNDPDLAKHLVDYADANKGNKDGVYNSVVVLGSLSKTALDPHKQNVESFLQSAAQQGTNTAAQVERVKSKLRAAE
jgi:hypothetical protein